MKTPAEHRAAAVEELESSLRSNTPEDAIWKRDRALARGYLARAAGTGDRYAAADAALTALSEPQPHDTGTYARQTRLTSIALHHALLADIES